VVVIVYEPDLEDVVKELGCNKQICLHKFDSYLKGQPKDEKYKGCGACKYSGGKSDVCSDYSPVNVSITNAQIWP
jgi:hypothetical protein